MNMPKLQNLITETFLQIFSKVFKINFKNLEFLFKQIKKALDIRAFLMVGMTRFELATPATRTRCATRLRYIPILYCGLAWLLAFSGSTGKAQRFDRSPSARNPLLHADLKSFSKHNILQKLFFVNRLVIFLFDYFP